MKNQGYKPTKSSLAFNKSAAVQLGLLTLCSSFAIGLNAAVVINEMDYDQPGTDTAEFIELFNSGASSISLDNFTVALINGANSASYQSIDLSGFNLNTNSFFVVCGDANLVTNCNHSFTTANGWFQNGSPDVVALYNNNSLVDSFSYEGILLPFTEGDVATISDSNTDITSISRIVDGVDTNNNALDFQLGCITPGTGNRAGSGDCSRPGVSPVPVPAAAWLFGSGLIGIAGLARRK